MRCLKYGLEVMIMNDALIKEVIKYKLAAVDKIINRMPPVISEELKALGKAVLEGINDGLQDKNRNPKQNTKLNDIKIE